MQVGPAAPGELESAIEDQLAATKSLTRVENIDLNLLAPRKIDWDLKRDVEKKLDKLERKTQRVIAELIRQLPFLPLSSPLIPPPSPGRSSAGERLAEGKTADLLSEVRAHTRESQIQRDARSLSDDDEEEV